jgi:Tfp pilus assembly protein PilO
MSPLRANLEYHARRAGIAGAVGVFVLTLLPGFYWMTLKPMHEEATRLAARVEAASKISPQADDAPRSRNERIRAFVEFFPARKDVPYWIGQIHAVAEKENLTLERGDYRRPTGDGPLPTPVRITLPVKGSYAQIRRFITATLAEVPTLALDEISFQRQGARDTKIEAQIRFTLYAGDK